MIPDDVAEFLRNSLGSLWLLELLLLLRRQTGRGWSAEALTRELRSSPGIVAGGLVQLGRLGLVQEDGETYRYLANAILDPLVERVATAYAQFPFSVTQAILMAPNQKIQLFADAFRIKRKE